MAKAKGRAAGRGNGGKETVRAAFIERREKGAGDWEVFRSWVGDVPAGTWLVLECGGLAERLTGSEFRYRYGTLTFDDDGSKCATY